MTLFLGQVERSDIEIVQISIFFIELSQVIMICMIPKFTLRGWRNEIYVLSFTRFSKIIHTLNEYALFDFGLPGDLSDSRNSSFINYVINVYMQ